MSRVVFLINSLAGGGAERVMTTLLRQSGDRAVSHELHLVLLDRETDAYSLPDFVTVHRLDAGGSLARSVLQTHALFRTLKADVVVSFLTRSNLVNVALAGLFGHRAIISERAHTSGHHGDRLSGRVSRTLIRMLYPRSDRVIAVSGGIANDLSRNFGVRIDRLVAIPNPVDAELLVIRAQANEPPVPTAPYVLGMGRLTKTKDFRLLLDAFAASDYRGDLILIGQGPEREALNARINELGIRERVTLTGFLENPFPLMRAADAYILPSRGEGFPNGLAEAMCLGVASISTNCETGPSELLDDATCLSFVGVHEGRFGLLCPVGEVAPLRDAISRIANPVYRDSLAERALAGSSRYSLRISVARYWAEIESALARC